MSQTKPPEASKRNTSAQRTQRAPTSAQRGQPKSHCGKLAENCGKSREIAKIAEICEKLRTSTPPPPVCEGTGRLALEWGCAPSFWGNRQPCQPHLPAPNGPPTGLEPPDLPSRPPVTFGPTLENPLSLPSPSTASLGTGWVGSRQPSVKRRRMAVRSVGGDRPAAKIRPPRPPDQDSPALH